MHQGVNYTVQRTVRALEILAQEGAISGAALARRLQMSDPTARRLLRSLASQGYVRGPLGTSCGSCHWELTPRLLEFASTVRDEHGVN
jgi:DNA-binding IclR family transcriptional regulator